MLERQTRPAQGLIEYPLRHPQHQSREAGSCMGRMRPFTYPSRNDSNPPLVVVGDLIPLALERLLAHRRCAIMGLFS